MIIITGLQIGMGYHPLDIHLFGHLNPLRLPNYILLGADCHPAERVFVVGHLGAKTVHIIQPLLRDGVDVLA